jgi:hypothetical protein
MALNMERNRGAMEMNRRRQPLVRTAISLGLAALLVAMVFALAIADDAAALRRSVAGFRFVQECADPAPSQECDEAPFGESFDGRTAKKVTVSFYADPDGCSPFRLHFVKDGRQVFVSEPLWPGDSVLDVSLGTVTERWRMWAEGVEGGCNTGHLGSWGGHGSREATLVRDRDAR